MKRIEIVVQLMAAIYSRKSAETESIAHLVDYCEKVAENIIYRNALYEERATDV
jgi:hypothetical protein